MHACISLLIPAYYYSIAFYSQTAAGKNC